MTVTIRNGTRKGVALLSGKINAAMFEAIRDMPGRKRWVDRDLQFEISRANIEYLKNVFPDADWQIDRADAIERLIKLEEDARAAKTRELPPEAALFRYKRSPREHQARAFMLSRDRVAYGLFLEQGLGKTKVVIDNAAYLWAAGKIDTLLIDAPNGVHAQWIEEQLPRDLPDWVPHKTLIYKSEQTKRWHSNCEDVLAYTEGLRIIAIHHDASATDKGVKFLRRVLSSCRVLWAIDESSRKIKTGSAQRTKNTLKLRDLAAFRRILDGTPVTRGAEDLYTQLMFLSDDVHGFSSFYTYRNRYCKVRPVPGAPTGVVEIYGYQNLDELQKRMDAWTLRLRSEDCLDLPERTYATRHVAMTDEQRRLYGEMKEEMITQLESGEVISAEQAIVKLLRLQQILCGHVKDEEGKVHSIKSNRANDALIAAEQGQGAKTLIWARFHHDIDTLVETFRKAGYKPVTWDGRTSIEDRGIAKRKFIDDPRVGPFIANPGSAGTGTDGLQHVSHSMIFYSNTFKASERWQAEARLFRDGQTGTVNVTDLVVPGTFDVHCLRVLRSRQDIATRTLDLREYLTDATPVIDVNPDAAEALFASDYR